MVGQRKIFEPVLFRAPRHLLDRRSPVGPGGVCMKVAAQIRKLEQSRQSMLCGFELATRLTQLRRNPKQIERAINLFFGPRRHRCAVAQQCRPVES
jgi:hypothetical protein